MNSLTASTDATTPLWPWSPSDRLRIEKCAASLMQHNQSLALFCTSSDFLSHNCQTLVNQLTAQNPELTVKYFSGEKSQPLLAKINERLADLSIDLAMKPDAISTPVKIWVVDKAHLLAVHELSLLQRLLKHFPSFGVGLVLLFTGPEQALPQSLEPGTRIESWNIPWTPPSQPKASGAMTLSRTSWAAVAGGLALIAAGLTWQTLAPGAAGNAPRQSATDTPAAAPTTATSEAAAASEATAASEVGAASDAAPASALPSASEALQAPLTPATVVAPAVSSNATPGVAQAALTASAPSEAAVPEPLPKVAVKGRQWLNTLPKDSFLIEHGQFSTVSKAQQLIQSKTWLANARIVPVYERDQGALQFSVLTGPFRSQERAQTFKSRQELPSTSKIRSRANVLAHSQAPGSKAKPAEKNR